MAADEALQIGHHILDAMIADILCCCINLVSRAVSKIRYFLPARRLSGLFVQRGSDILQFVRCWSPVLIDFVLHYAASLFNFLLCLPSCLRTAFFTFFTVPSSVPYSSNVSDTSNDLFAIMTSYPPAVCLGWRIFSTLVAIAQ